MARERFDIIFSARLLEDADPARVRAALAARFKLDDRHLERLFSGRPVTIKRGVDLDTASRYRLAFRTAGALVDIRPSSDPPVPPQPAAAEGGALSLAPADGRPLVSSPAPAPVEIDTSRLHLDLDPKTPLDPSPPPRPPAIDTSALGLAPQAPLDPPPAPPPPALDLSGLSVAAEDDTPLDPSPPPPPPAIDIGGLRLDSGDAPLAPAVSPEPPHIDTTGLSLAPPGTPARERDR